MNNCAFYGRIASEPKTEEVNGVPVTLITLCVERFRQSKVHGKVKERTFLNFEAWDSAATTIAKHCVKGDFLLVPSATARTNHGEVVFRINEFRSVKSNRSDIDEELGVAD